MPFDFCSGFYQSRSVAADAQLTMNMYPEILGPDARSRVALYPSPGLETFNDLSQFLDTDSTLNCTASRIFAGANTLPGGNYYLVVTMFSVLGETKISSEFGPFGAGGTAWLHVGLPSIPTAVKWRVYYTQADGAAGTESQYQEFTQAQVVVLGYTILIGAPGTNGHPALNKPSGAPIRGQSTINGRAFAIGGNVLFEIFSNQTATPMGFVGQDGKPVQMCYSTSELLFASAGICYRLDLTTNVLSTPNTQLGPISVMAYSDGFFIALLVNSQTFQISNVNDGSKWDPTQVAQVSIFPDNIVSMLVDHREIWLLGVTKSTCYYNSGASPFPFIPYESAYIEQGSAATFAPSKIDNTILFIGADERGQGVAWRINGYIPQRISTHAVETAWASYPTISDAVSYAFQMEGHSFWQIRFPSASKTWVYDVATNLWHQRDHYGERGLSESHLSQNHVFVFGKHLVGDWKSAKIYEMALPLKSTGVTAVYPYNLEILPRIFSNSILTLDLGVSVIGRTYDYDVKFKNLGSNTIGYTVMGVTGTLGSGLTQEVSGSLVGDGATEVMIQFASLASSTGVELSVYEPTITVGGVSQLTAQEKAYQDPPWSANVKISVTYPNTVGKDWRFCDDDSTPIRRIRRSPYISEQRSRIWIPGFKLDAQGGVGPAADGLVPEPLVSLRTSNDFGETWSNCRTRGIGFQGQYKRQLLWLRLGESRGTVIEASFSDPYPLYITDGYIASQ